MTRCGEELPGTRVELVEGGDSRHASEFNVLRYLAADIESGAIDVVLIHDAARPLAGAEMMQTAVTVAREFGGAVPALGAPDVVEMGPAGPCPAAARPQPRARADPAGIPRATTATGVSGGGA